MAVFYMKMTQLLQFSILKLTKIVVAISQTIHFYSLVGPNIAVFHIRLPIKTNFHIRLPIYQITH